MTKTRQELGRSNRRKGNRGVLEAKRALEELMPGALVEIVHSTGRKDMRGGDLLLNGCPVQVKYGASVVPKTIYKFFPDGCLRAMVRRVGPREKGFPWVWLYLVPGPLENEASSIEGDKA